MLLEFFPVVEENLHVACLVVGVSFMSSLSVTPFLLVFINHW